MGQQNQRRDTEITRNKKARHDYEITDTLEAGLVLLGWEVKSLRTGRINLNDTYVLIQRGEAYLVGAHITPLATASTHIRPEPVRARKLLLHRQELNKLIGFVERKGYTLVPLRLYWKQGRAKLQVGLGKGKKLYDKRADIKARDWQRDQARLFKKR
ncbi:MAG: SsrA-binding protein SmpB [Pseudomonadota bacterium]